MQYLVINGILRCIHYVQIYMYACTLSLTISLATLETEKYFNSLPNNKILDWSKLKAFAEDKIYVNEKLKFGLGTVEKIEVKGENAGYQHFLLFPQCFQKASFSRLLKAGIVW